MTELWGDEENDDLLDWDDPTAESPEAEREAEIERELSLTGGPSVTAALPGGGGSLVVSGPGAGTQVIAGVQSPSAASSNPVLGLRSRDEALLVGSPLMFVHRPHQRGVTIPRLLANIFVTTGGAVSLGAAVALPSATTQGHKEWLDTCKAASVKIADPLGYQLDRDLLRVKKISDRSMRYMPYLAKDPLDVDEVLQAQRDAGANLLLSPGRALDATDAQTALDTAFADADKALAGLVVGERLALNLTLSEQWLSKPTLREALFNQLMDQQQFGVWYIRVQWPANLRALHQPLKVDLLQGYKRLAQLAQDEDRVLLLPQTGLTGWLQLAFGSTAFGAGPFGAGQAFKEHIQGGGGGQEPVARYFEPSLLHSVERTVHDALSKQTDYVACDCPYCPALLAPSAPAWNHELARLHHLHSMGRLAGLGASTGRPLPVAVRRIVREAKKTAADQPLAGISSPQHLPVWDQLL
jgi:hypothetical protein